MEHAFIDIYLNTTFIQMAAMIAGGLFFVAVGVRELKTERIEGLLFVALAGFFLAMHLYLFWNLPEEISILPQMAGATMWVWLVTLLAPALIVLFLGFGLFSFLITKVREGLVRTFFGLTLFCYLFMVGTGWPVDVKGILTAIYSLVWIELELNAGA